MRPVAVPHAGRHDGAASLLERAHPLQGVGRVANTAQAMAGLTLGLEFRPLSQPRQGALPERAETRSLRGSGPLFWAD